MDDDTPLTFHWADYLVFCLSLLVSAAIGIYFGCFGKRQQTTAEFLLGGRDMPALPVALSNLASFLSAPSILGTPTELYYFGTMYLLSLVGYLLASFIAAHLFVPVFHRMQLTSAYELLELRFDRKVRILGAILFCFMTLLYMGVSAYAPAIAFSQVTGLDLNFSILGVALICTFYTAIGGIKAVIWTDTIQMCIIILGMLSLLIVSTIKIGSVSEIASIVEEGGRWKWDEVSLDPRVRYTVWGQFFGIMVTSISVNCSNQACIQRFMCIKKARDAQKSVYYIWVGLVVYVTIASLLGLVMYAHYHTCDPLLSGKVQRADQIVPYFIMQIFGKLHGIPGLFSAAVFSATLSTVSSGLNSMAAVILTDFAKPIYRWRYKSDIEEGRATIFSKVTAVVLGLVTIGLAYLAPFLGATLMQISMSVFGLIAGPMFSLFLLGIFVPWCNSWGAIAGVLSGIGFSLWMSLAAIFNKPPFITLPISTEGCYPTDNTTLTTASYTTASYTTAAITTEGANIDLQGSDDSFHLYHSSYVWLGLYSVTVSVVVGCVVSAMTGCNRGKTLRQDIVFDYPGKCGCGGRCGACWMGEDQGEKNMYVVNGDMDLRSDGKEGKLSYLNTVCKSEI